jgi:non-heme chloroperoxidase
MSELSKLIAPAPTAPATLAMLPTSESDPSSVALSYSDSGGSGRPVVLIHGWPLDRRSWLANAIEFEANGFRVVSYDRRGFGSSEKPTEGYDYDVLTADLNRLLTELDLQDVSLIGFSMGGGEVARYISQFGEDRLRSVIFAAAVPPFLLQTEDNPEGPLANAKASEMEAALRNDRSAFFEEFTTTFFSVNGELAVSEQQRQTALAMCGSSGVEAALACMTSFATTDFRDDLTTVTVPTLVIHGDSDATVPFEGSGKRTNELIKHSEFHVIQRGPHGINVANAAEFNQVVLEFLKADSIA